MNYLASPPLCVAYALAGTMDIDIAGEPLGQDEQGEDVYLRDIWPTEQEIAQTIGEAVRADMFRKSYGEVFAGDERWNGLEVPSGERFAWDEQSTYVRLPPYFQDMPAEPPPISELRGRARARAARRQRHHRPHLARPARSSATGPPGAYLQEQGVAPRDFNSYGSRRGNHEVMMRGTFANIRLRNQLAPGHRGRRDRAICGHRRTAVRWSASRCRSTTRRCATPRKASRWSCSPGKEYGSGSSRDWAAKGTKLLGVRAVIAQSFERIHRSNLVGMGVLPLQFPEGESAQSLGLTGEEVFAIEGLADAMARRGRRRRPRGGRARRARRRGDGRVRRARAHRHAARGRVLPPRRHPAVRPATAARRMSERHGKTAHGAAQRAGRSCSTCSPRAGRPAMRRRPGRRVARGGRLVRRGEHRRRGHAARARRAQARLRVLAAAPARDGPHRRDRADRHAHRRRRVTCGFAPSAAGTRRSSSASAS